MKARGLLASVVAVVATIALSACAGMPMSGAVTVGRTSDDVDDSLDISFRPAGPQKGATPQQIVEGFIAAGTNPTENWATAREFLAPGTKWDPNAGVEVDDLVDRHTTVESDESVTMTLRALAEVDETGVYSETDAGTVRLPFTLAKQADGEWRITKATDGIVLDRDLFGDVYRSYSLMWFDTSWKYLVPDTRWFPARNNTAYRIVQALIDGAPSAWLTGAVTTAFPDDVNAPDSVPIDTDGRAEVEMPPAALGLPATQLDRMQAQLEASLASANISGAVMSVGAVDIDATPVATQSTRVDPRPAVLTKDGFGFLTSSELQPIAGISQGMKALQPVSVELGRDQASAAVRLESGAVVRLKSDQKYDTLDAREGVVDPTIDPEGFVWSLPAAHPSSLVAFAPDGSPHDVADAWSGASRVRAMQVSRDGARIVALVDAGGRSEAWIAGVVRNKDGVPVRLGQPMRLTVLSGSGLDIAWLDDTSVGILSSVDGDPLFLTVQVGGLVASRSAPAAAAHLAGGNQPVGVRVLSSEGTLYVPTGTRWQTSATGIQLLATQQGSPQ